MNGGGGAGTNTRQHVVYVLRHGVRVDFEDRTWSATAANPDDPPLSASGINQAREVVAYFEKEGVEVGVIYSSPYTRCVQTASFVADAFRVPIRVEKGITEWPEKHDIRPPDSAAIALQFPEVDESYTSLLNPTGKQETVKEHHERCKELVQVMEEVPGRLANYPKVTLMVTHAAPFVALVRGFLGNNKASLFPGTCGLVKLVRVDGEEEKVATEERWEIAFDGLYGIISLSLLAEKNRKYLLSRMKREERPQVPQVSLSSEGPVVSQLVMGTWKWNTLPKELHMAIFDECLKLGITTFDTADVYGDYTSEGLLGDVLHTKTESGDDVRSKIQIVTKTGICAPVSGKTPYKIQHYDTSFGHIIMSVTNSLRNLKTNYIDLLLLHYPDLLMDADEVAKAFTILRDDNRVRHFGLSNHSVHQFELLQSRLTFPLVTNQVELSPVFLDHLFNGTLDQCQRLRVVPMAWSPLRGLFVEQERVGTGVVDTSKREKIVAALKSVGEQMSKVSEGEASRGGVTEDQVALAWVMRHPSHPVPVLGTSKVERIRSAVEACFLEMNREQWYEILIASQGKGVT